MFTGDAFPVLKNDLIIKSAFGYPVKTLPIWIMRQTGRYLPEFQKLLDQYGFFKICQTPELACEATLLPINRFSLDAAIIFSDILVIPQALGQIVEMDPDKGPIMPNPINNPEMIKSLNWNVNVETKLKYVFDAISLTRHKLDGICPLIGFAGGPWTLMSYMIEGGSSTTSSKSKKWLYDEKNASHDFLNKLCGIVCKFLLEQIKSGAQLLQIFESNAGILSPDQFTEFCLPYLKTIVSFLKSEMIKLHLSTFVPIIIFAKDAHYAIEELSNIECDVVGLDWTLKPLHARRLVANKVSLQGNLDPCALYGTSDDIIAQTRCMLEKFGCQKYIVNLGDGIYPDTDPEKVHTFVTAVHTLSQEMIEIERNNFEFL